MNLRFNTFYHGDCLFVMNHDLAAESVDLIYLDPPFFTGKLQTGKWRYEWHPEAMEVSFEDSKRFWSEKADEMRKKAPGWLRHIAIKRPDFASYLYYMMERLDSCYRVLKKTGSIYLHCDYRASHYLKMVMDEIFGVENFINEIVWCYKSGGASPKHHFSRKHDVILFYSRSENYIFNPQQEKSYNRDLKPYRFAGVQEYQDEIGWYTMVGMKDYWQIDMVGRTSSERVGYPTQKPAALLERIIKASSKEDDWVLDPFCGCGTTLIAANQLNRRWIGIDIDTSLRNKGELPTAFTVIKNRNGMLFDQSQYISRDLKEIQEMGSHEFEDWVNEFYKADKPSPDKGVDGITYDGIPIQSKTHIIKYPVLSEFITNAKLHPNVLKPVKKVILISQKGFDDGARQRMYEIETTEGIKVVLDTPAGMLGEFIKT